MKHLFKSFFSNTWKVRYKDRLCYTYSVNYHKNIFPKSLFPVEPLQYNFPGYTGFAPSYRYEPYTIQFSSWTVNRIDNPFYVKENPVNDPPVPSHQYVSYPYPNKSVWDMIYDYSQLVNVGSASIYGARNSDGTMDFWPYEPDKVPVIKEYYNILKYFTDYLKLELSIAADSARERFITYIRDIWNGGAKNVKAQTRVAASYGLLQMLYSTAVSEVGYIEDREHLPEYLNITDTIMVLSMKHQKKLLVKALSSNVELGSNWPQGFEKTFFNYVYGQWNSALWYRNEVKVKASLFLPQNK